MPSRIIETSYPASCKIPALVRQRAGPGYRDRTPVPARCAGPLALQDGRLFLVGHRLTTADMLLTTCLDWAVSYRVPISPACRSYLERITSRPAYRAGLAANTPRSTA